MGVFRPGQFTFVCLPPGFAPGSKRLWLLNISAPNSWPSYTRGLCLASGFWQVVTKVVVCFLPGACGVRCLMCMGDSLETTCGCSGGSPALAFARPLLPLRGRPSIPPSFPILSDQRRYIAPLPTFSIKRQLLGHPDEVGGPSDGDQLSTTGLTPQLVARPQAGAHLICYVRYGH